MGVSIGPIVAKDMAKHVAKLADQSPVCLESGVPVALEMRP